MLNYFILILLYLSNLNLRLIEKELNDKKHQLISKNLTYSDYDKLKREIEFIELNKLRIIIQEPLD